MLFPSYKEAVAHVSQTVLDQQQQQQDAFVKCGDLACQHNSFQKLLDHSKILSAAAFQEEDTTNAAKGKKKKKNKNKKNFSEEGPTPTANEKAAIQYVVALSDSILFPEGGGQPSDHGILSLRKDENENENDDNLKLQVINVQNEQNICVATCLLSTTSQPDDILGHLHTHPTVSQSLDWDRRFDLMTQHSAQHLISAVAMNLFDMPTHSFSLQAVGASYIDFALSEEEPVDYYQDRLQTIEATANDYIRQNLPMTPMWLAVDDPLFQTKVRSRLLPKGLSGKIRLVEIGSDATSSSIDCNTCCGTHVAKLGQLQMIQFFKKEKVKSTILRVHYAAAQRLLALNTQSFQREQQLTQLLGCPKELHVERLTTLLDDKKATQNKLKTLQQTLCDCLGKEIVTELKQGTKVVMRVLDPEIISDLAVLSNAVWEQMDSNNDGMLLLLVSGSAFLLTGDADLVDQVGKPLTELLKGRGGGRKGKFQGKLVEIPTEESLQAAEQFLQQQAAAKKE